MWAGAFVAAFATASAHTPAPASVRAQGQAQLDLSVASWHAEQESRAGRVQWIVRGLVRNSSEAAREWQGTRLELLDADDAVLAAGVGAPLLPALGAGEDGPFEARAVVLEADAPAVQRIRLQPLGGRERPDRDRSLRLGSVITTTLGGATSLLGELENEGALFLQAAETRLHVAFFEDERIVALRAATIPVRYGRGVDGQGHAPGERYPWLLPWPEARALPWRAWLVSEPYPAGRWPVPVGLVDLRHRMEPSGDRRYTAELVNCGFRRVAEARVLVVERDEQGRPMRFAAADLALRGPLGPGNAAPVDITVSGFGGDGLQLTLHAHALASQAVAPSAWPCRERPRYGRLWLPALSLRAIDPRVGQPYDVPASHGAGLSAEPRIRR